MTFKYSEAPQRSPEWIEIRTGKVTASRLKDWLATSKSGGKPLKARLDYEKELAFEREFNVPFERFVTAAMQQGQLMEEFLKRQYEKQFDVIVRPVGCYYSDSFVASPDGEVDGDGLVECKWVYDSSFSDVLTEGAPEAHMLQMQGQLWASGRKWCDYVVGNQHTGKFTVIRVARSEEVIKAIEDSLKDPKLSVWVKSVNVFDFSEQPKLSPLNLDKEF
jgi:predicted phage-related endonuclease